MTRPTPKKFLRKFTHRYRGGHHVGYVLRQKRGCRLVRYDVFTGGHRYRGKWKKSISWTAYHVESWTESWRNGKTQRAAWHSGVQTKDARWARQCFNRI